jgi:integrase/recombinase
MGHTSEKSSYIYNKRHIIEQANKLVLLEQEELLSKLSNKIVEKND